MSRLAKRISSLASLRSSIFPSPIPRTSGGHILSSPSIKERNLLYYPPNVNNLKLSKYMGILPDKLQDVDLEVRLYAEERGAVRGKEFRVLALSGWQKKSAEKKSKGKKRR